MKTYYKLDGTNLRIKQWNKPPKGWMEDTKELLRIFILLKQFDVRDALKDLRKLKQMRRALK